MSEWKDVTDKEGKPVTLESSEMEWKDVKNDVGGNVTINPYTTFTIMDSKGIPHKISGKDEADAYRQALASGITPGASTSKERNRIVEVFGLGPDSFGAKLGPEKTRAVLETGDWSLVDAAKDAFTLPQRAVAGLFGGDMGKTSDEYASEGKTLKSMATSPLIVPNVLAGVSTGGLSLPVQIATTGGVGVGSGLLLDDNYGGGDIAFDIGASLLPTAGPLLGAGIKSNSKRAIAKQLKGSPNVQQLLTKADKASRKYAKDFGELVVPPEVPPSVVTTKSLEDLLARDKVRKNIINRVYGDDVDVNKLLSEVVYEQGYNSPDLAKSVKQVSSEFTDKITDFEIEPMADELLSVAKSKATQRTLETGDVGDVRKVASAIEQFNRDLADLADMTRYSPELKQAQYRKLYEKYSNIPEVAEYMGEAMQAQGKQNFGFLADHIEKPMKLDDLYKMYKESVPNTRHIWLSGLPDEVAKLNTPQVTTPFLQQLASPLETVAGKASKVWNSPRKKFFADAAYNTRYPLLAPSLLPEEKEK